MVPISILAPILRKPSSTSISQQCILLHPDTGDPPQHHIKNWVQDLCHLIELENLTAYLLETQDQYNSFGGPWIFFMGTLAYKCLALQGGGVPRTNLLKNSADSMVWWKPLTTLSLWNSNGSVPIVCSHTLLLGWAYHLEPIIFPIYRPLFFHISNTISLPALFPLHTVCGCWNHSSALESIPC